MNLENINKNLKDNDIFCGRRLNSLNQKTLIKLSISYFNSSLDERQKAIDLINRFLEKFNNEKVNVISVVHRHNEFTKQKKGLHLYKRKF